MFKSKNFKKGLAIFSLGIIYSFSLQANNDKKILNVDINLSESDTPRNISIDNVKNIEHIRINFIGKNDDLLGVYRLSKYKSAYLKSQKSTNKASQLQPKISKASLLPSLDLVSTLGYSKTYLSSNSSDNESYKYFDNSITLTQILYSKGLFDTYKLNIENAKVAQTSYDLIEMEFMLNISKAYFNVLAQKSLLKVAQTSLKSIKSNLDNIQEQKNVGVSTETDLMKAKASFFSAKANLESKEVALKNAFQNLNALANQEVSLNIKDLKEYLNLEKFDLKSLDYWQKIALKNNLTLKKAKESVKVAKRNIDLANSAWYPNIQLQASYGFQNEFSGSSGFNETQTQGGTILLGLSWEIFSGGEKFAQKSQANYGLLASEFALTQAIRTIKTTVKNDYLNLLSIQKQLVAYKSAKKASELAYEAYQNSYKSGLSTITDVLESIEKLSNAESNLEIAKYKAITDYLQLKYDIGTLNIKDIKTINNLLI